MGLKQLYLSKNKKSIIIEIDYSPTFVLDIRKIPARSYNPDKKQWSIRINNDTLSLLIDLFEKYDFDVSEEVTKILLTQIKEKVAKEKKQESNLKESQLLEGDIKIKGLKKKLWPFQKAGIQYIIKNKRVLVGDEMGLGKTIEAIGAIHQMKLYPILVVCPNSMKYTWEREYVCWVDKRVKILNSEDKIKEYIKKIPDVTIMNYNTVTKYKEELKAIEYLALVVDESHYLKNSKAKRTKAVKQIAKNKETILFLTGTPILNRPSELISQLQILGWLDDFGGWWNFIYRYCDVKHNAWGMDISGSSNVEELHEKLRRICYIRRNKKDVLKELPEKQRVVISFDIDNMKEYRKAEVNIVEYLKEKMVEGEEFKQSLLGLSIEEKEKRKEEYQKEVQNRAEAAEHLVQINSLKQISARGKMNSIIQWIEDFLESGEKLIIVCTHIEIINIIVEKFKCNKIDGSIGIKSRERYIEDFQINDKTKLLALNIQTGGVGITLTSASNMAIVELGWTPGEHSQVEDRLHRIGQKNAVTIYYLLGRKTIDEDIYELIEKKRRVTDGINMGIESDIRVSIMGELLERLVEKNK